MSTKVVLIFSGIPSTYHSKHINIEWYWSVQKVLLVTIKNKTI